MKLFVIIKTVPENKKKEIINVYSRGQYWTGIEYIGTKAEVQEEFNRILGKHYMLIHPADIDEKNTVDKAGWYNESGDFVCDADEEKVDIDGSVYEIQSLKYAYNQIVTWGDDEDLKSFKSAVSDATINKY